jgi:hypothetical protein
MSIGSAEQFLSNVSKLSQAIWLDTRVARRELFLGLSDRSPGCKPRQRSTNSLCQVGLMVDARLRGEWLNSMRFDQLSDIAWRVFTAGLMWSNEQGTDGAIPDRYVRLLHPNGEQPDAVAELVAAIDKDGRRLWERTPGGYQIVEWDSTMGQSSADYVQRRKEANRKAQQTWRDNRKPSIPQSVSEVRESADESAHVSDYVSRHVGPGSGSIASKENGEPPLFCVRHPHGSMGAPCRGCGDARLLHEQWTRTQKTKPTPTTPAWKNPEACDHPAKHPVDNYCLVCEQVFE